MSEFYQSDTYNDPRFYSSPQWQLDKCYEKYSTWVNSGVISSRLYGWNVRGNSKDKFYFNSTL